MNNLINLNENSKNAVVKFSLDKYSKIVLSIIAVCLLLITANMYLKPGDLNAYQTVQDVNIKSVNGTSLWGSELPVNIQSVKGKSLWDDKLPVDIKSINGSFIFGSDLPVKVK